MTFLPIVERELRVASRRAATYRLRWLAATVALVIFGWMLLTLWRDAVPSASHGRFLFRSLIGLGFGYCLLAGVRLTSDCLSEEKREGTLGLLFLTDLRGMDVVLGKLAATSVTSFYGLMAIIPVIGLTVQLGGVTGGELVRAALVLMNTLFVSLAAGMLVSTWSRQERKALFAGILLMASLTLGPWLLALFLGSAMSGILGGPEESWWVFLPSPAFALGFVMLMGLPALPFPAASFWWSLACCHAVGWGMLWVAGRGLSRSWQQGDGPAVLERWPGLRIWHTRLERATYGEPEDRRLLRRTLLNINPFLWLAGRERWKPSYVWVYLGAVSGTWLWGAMSYGSLMWEAGAMVPAILLLQTFFKVWILSEACSRLAEDQRSGALELLLSTPLSVEEILRGQWLALRRQFGWPLVVLALVVTVGAGNAVGWRVAGINLVGLLVDAVALGWVGMWLGLTSRNPARAILEGVARVLALPWVLYYLVVMLWQTAERLLGWRLAGLPASAGSWFWLGLSLITSVGFGFIWAARRLRRDFRLIAAQRHEAPGGRRRWWRGWSDRGRAVQA